MKLVFVGADHEVTGSCHYLEVAGKHILVDYGMEQGVNVFENVPLPVAESMIDYVFLTHAHVDHSGLLPLLYARGFRGQIYTTDATADLCSIMLRDCAHIQSAEAEWKNRKAKRSANNAVVEPLYTMEDADGVIRRFVPCHYNTIVEVCEGVKIRFTDIGHLLGSASIEVWLTEDGNTKKIVFSGDIGNKHQPLLKDPTPTKEADYVVMESTYGDRLHPKDKLDYVAELTKVLQETLDRGGNVVIPSFAVGRTQEILYFLRKIKVGRLVKGHEDFPVYVDSPMAVEATGIFQENRYECFDDEAMEYVKEGSDWYLRVYIDKEGGITVDDCEVISREFNEVLDKENYIPDQYIFEVSSPGLLRPLKKEKDYQRSIGKLIDIKLYRAEDKQKEFTGVLKAYDEKTVTLAFEKDEEKTFERANLAMIRLAFCD